MTNYHVTRKRLQCEIESRENCSEWSKTMANRVSSTHNQRRRKRYTGASAAILLLLVTLMPLSLPQNRLEVSHFIQQAGRGIELSGALSWLDTHSQERKSYIVLKSLFPGDSADGFLSLGSVD